MDQEEEEGGGEPEQKRSHYRSAMEEAAAEKRLLATLDAFESTQQKYNRMRTLPGDIHISLKTKYYFDVLSRESVRVVLRAAITSIDVRRMIDTNDGLWKAWWVRDFPDFIATLSSDIPEWAVAASQHGGDERYIRVPWRSYYSWCLFLRRRCMKEFAILHFARTASRIAKRAAEVVTTIAPPPFDFSRGMPLSAKYELDSTDVWMTGLAFHFDRGTGPVTYITPEEAFDDHYVNPIGGSKALWPVKTGEQIPSLASRVNRILVTGESAVYWYAKLVYHQAGMKAYDPSLLRVAEEFEVDQGPDKNPKKIPAAALGFDYSAVLSALVAWYMDMESRLPTNRVFYDMWTGEGVNRTAVLMNLPPAPQIDGQWFIGDSVVLHSAVSISSPVCVGCGAPNAENRCAVCKKPYCTEDCQQVNWKVNCTGCVTGIGY